MLKKILTLFLSLLVLLLLLCLLALYLAPGIGLHVANNWYSQQGEGYELSAQQWHFSPFNLRLELQGVQLLHPTHGTGKTELNKILLHLDPQALWHHAVKVHRLELQGLRLAVDVRQQQEQQAFEIAGITLGQASPEELEESETSDDFEPEPWTIELKQLHFKDLQIGWNLQLNEQHIEGQVSVDKLALTNLSSDAASTPKLALALRLKELTANQPMVNLVSPLDINTQGTLSQLFTNPTYQGDITINGLALEQEDNLISIDTIAINQLHANAQQQSVAQVEVSDVSILQLTELLLVQLEKIQLGKLSNHDLVQQLETLKITQFTLSSQQKELVTLAAYELEGLQLEQQENTFQIDLGQHQYQGLMVDIELDKQGALVGLNHSPNELEALTEQEQQAQQKSQPELELQESAAAKALAIALVSFLQQNTNETASILRLKDHSVSPKLNTKIVLKKLAIGQLHSQVDGTNIQLDKAVPISLTLGIGDFSQTDIDATLSLYEHQGQFYPEGNIKLKTRKLDIVDFNGYLIKALGYQLNRGSLDIDADITIHQLNLSGEIHLLLRNSKFVPADEETIDKISKQISMPLDTAIGLLRDKNGNVKLTIPVEGRLDDPDFGLKDITRQLTNKALKATTVFFLKQSLQPYGTMVSVASFAGSHLFAIRLDALQYVANQTDLTDDHQANLKKVGELMQSKNQIEVRACPMVSAEEAEVLGEDWSELARERGQKVQAWFAEHFAAQAERLTLCRPQQGKNAEVVLGVN